MKFAKPLFAPHTSAIERVWYFTLRGLAVLTLLYLILPVLAIVPLSFSSSTFLVYPIPGWSLRWYQNLVMSDEWRMAAKNSFIVGPAATLVATVLGTLAAIGITKADFRGKAVLMAVLISPMIVPVVVVGVGMYLFFAPLGLANTYLGLILAHASLGVPFVVTTVAATLQGFNYNLVRASLSLGANPVSTFFRITLPVIAPGVISGALFAFATSFDEVVVTLFLALRFEDDRIAERWGIVDNFTLMRTLQGIAGPLAGPPGGRPGGPMGPGGRPGGPMGGPPAGAPQPANSQS